jgi:hypothetical protein
MRMRWWRQAGSCVLGGCQARWLLTEWCRHCRAQVERVPDGRGYVHSASCEAVCGNGTGRSAEPGGAPPGEDGELAHLRARVGSRWHVHVIPPGYIAVRRDRSDSLPLFGVTPSDLAWAVNAVEAGR